MLAQTSSALAFALSLLLAPPSSDEEELRDPSCCPDFQHITIYRFSNEDPRDYQPAPTDDPCARYTEVWIEVDENEYVVLSEGLEARRAHEDSPLSVRINFRDRLVRQAQGVVELNITRSN